MAAERLSSSFVKLNLSAIKKSDQFVVNIVDTASQVALYKFNGETQAWEKTDVEGALFVYSRSTSPTSAFFIMNRLNMKNMMEPITSNMEFKLQDPFLLYRNITKGIFGIWFYDSEECKRLATLMNKLSSQTMMMGNSVESNPPAADIPQASQEAKTEEKVDIMQLFAKAQERYNKQTKTSSSAALASPMASPQNQQQISQEQREQHQRFLQENQLQKEQLQRLFKNEDTRPRKQRAYSSPTPNLPGQTPKTPKGDGLQNGVLPRAEGNSSRKTEKMKSLTLSDVKAPISSGESKQIMTTQDDSVIDTSKPGAQRKLFQNERAEPKSAGTIPMPSAAPQSTGVSQVKESPQKSLPDQGSMAGASLMSPLAFQSSGKVTIMTSPAQSKQPPKMEIAPLTEEQLVQALTYLLKNDAEFVTKIHEAYFKSLQDKLPT